jgi:hypothetical protein
MNFKKRENLLDVSSKACIVDISTEVPLPPKQIKTDFLIEYAKIIEFSS